MATKTVDQPSAPAAVTRRHTSAPVVVSFRALRLLPAPPPRVCTETVEALEVLLAGARSGQIIGIAFALMTNKREYITDVIGAFYTDLTLARGAVATLDDELREIARYRAQPD